LQNDELKERVSLAEQTTIRHFDEQFNRQMTIATETEVIAHQNKEILESVQIDVRATTSACQSSSATLEDLKGRLERYYGRLSPYKTKD
jgi:hypothetical protein